MGNCMNIINAKTLDNADIYLAVIEDSCIWTSDVTKLKLFASPEDAAIFITLHLQKNISSFENYHLAKQESIKISQLTVKELY